MVDPPPPPPGQSSARPIAPTIAVVSGGGRGGGGGGSGVRQTIESFDVPLLLPSERRRKRRKDKRMGSSASSTIFTVVGEASNTGNGILSRLGLRRSRNATPGASTPSVSSIASSSSRVPSNSSTSSSLSMYYDKEQYPPNIPPHFLDSEPSRTRRRTEQLWNNQLWPAVDKLLRAFEARGGMNPHYRQIVFKSSMYNVCKEFNRSTENVKVELKQQQHQQQHHQTNNTTSSDSSTSCYTLEVSLLTGIPSTVRNARSYTAEIPQVGTDMIPVMSHYVGTAPTTTAAAATAAATASSSSCSENTLTPTSASASSSATPEEAIIVSVLEGETIHPSCDNVAMNGGGVGSNNNVDASSSSITDTGGGASLPGDRSHRQQQQQQHAEVVEIVSLRDGYQQIPLIALSSCQRRQDDAGFVVRSTSTSEIMAVATCEPIEFDGDDVRTGTVDIPTISVTNVEPAAVLVVE